MEVVRGQHSLHARLYPTCLGNGLALGAAPVAAGIEEGMRKVARRADVQMPAERLRAASLDIAHGLELVARQTMSPFVRLPMRTEDVRDFWSGLARPRRGLVQPLAMHAPLLRWRTCLNAQPIQRARRRRDELLAHMCVDCCAADRTMPEKLLDEPDVFAVFQQVRGKRVSLMPSSA